MDMPAETAGTYFQMSLNAFTTASALEPENAGLKAAVKFLREQTASVSTFEQSRDTATDTFLDGASPRPRRDEERSIGTRGQSVTAVARAKRPSPDVPAYRRRPAPGTPKADAAAQAAIDSKTDPDINSSEPLTSPTGSVVPVAEASKAITPARENAPSTDSANMGMQLDYSDADTSPLYFAGAYRYQPYFAPGQGAYSFQEYTSAYYPPGGYANSAQSLITPQRLGTSMPITPNRYEQNVLNKSAAPRRDDQDSS